jgi:hypothetical protein
MNVQRIINDTAATKLQQEVINRLLQDKIRTTFSSFRR